MYVLLLMIYKFVCFIMCIYVMMVCSFLSFYFIFFFFSLGIVTRGILWYSHRRSVLRKLYQSSRCGYITLSFHARLTFSICVAQWIQIYKASVIVYICMCKYMYNFFIYAFPSSFTDLLTQWYIFMCILYI